MRVEERLLLDRIALDAAHVTPRHAQGSVVVEADLADADGARRQRTAVAAGDAPQAAVGQCLVQVARSRFVRQNLSQCGHGWLDLLYKVVRTLTACEPEDSLMTRAVLVGVATVVLSSAMHAQVYQWRTPPPPVTAQYAEWQFSDEPIIVNSIVYYPTRETRFFDGGIMAQVGVYRSVPAYADVTLEPHSVIYLPVGRNLVRGYERKRTGELAGTQGSRVPAFRVDVPSAFGPREPEVPLTAVEGTSRTEPPLVREPMAAVRLEPTSASVKRTRVESIPPPSGINGVWLV